MNRKIIFSALLGGYALFAQPALSDEVRRQPVHVHIADDVLDSMSPARRALVDQMVSVMKSELSYITEYEPVLPTSVFTDDDARIVSLNSLFVSPSDQELDALATDENGDAIPLDDAQRAQIRRDAMFVIPSVAYPDQKHVWRVSSIVQKGRENIEVSFNEDMGSALNHVIVYLPDRVSADKPISLGRAFTALKKGFRGIASQVVGLSETLPRYLDYEVDELIEVARNDAMRTVIAAYEAEGEEAPATLDGRLYDTELSEALSTTLDDLRADMTRAWKDVSDQKRREIREELRAQGRGKDAVAELLAEARDAFERDFVTHYAPLEEQAPGYGRLLANHNHALYVAEKVEANLAEIMQAQGEVIEANLRIAHPSKARSAEWLARRVAEESHAFYQDIRWTHLQWIPAILEDEGLLQEAHLFKAMIAFQQQQEEALRADLEAERVPGRTFDFKMKKWSPQDWTAVRHEGYDGRVWYAEDRYEHAELTSDMPFWRLQALGMEARADFFNGNYNLLVSNLWNGPLGVRALVGKDAFTPHYRMDRDTGEYEVDERRPVHTMRSRLSSIWTKVFAARESFETAPDTGFLGKRYTRWLNKLWNYGVKGAGASAVVAVGQPIATVGNVALSGLGVVSSPLWAPLSGLAKMTLATTLYDFNNPRTGYSFLPILRYGIGDVAIAGVGQGALAGAGVVLHPVAGAATAGYAYARKAVRSGYDDVMASLLLDYARRPARNSFLARRIAGPGLSSEYYFQLAPEVAVLAAVAALEKMELTRYFATSSAEVKKPVADYMSFLHGVIGEIGRVMAGRTDVLEEMKRLEAEHGESLGAAVKERRALLDRLSTMPLQAARIKQTAEDLERTIAMGTVLIEEAFADHIRESLSEAELAALWESADVAEDDYEGLCRYLLTHVFGEGFLVPMEASDEDFVIDVGSADLKERFANLTEGRAAHSA